MFSQSRLTTKRHAGFTLMEVMVSVSIFTIVVIVGIGSLLTINETYRKSQTDRKAVDSLTYNLEAMSRRIRTAQTWGGVIGTPTNSFSFKDQDGVDVSYQYDLVTPDHIAVTETVQGGTPETYDITPDGVHIDSSVPGGGMWFTQYQAGPTGQKYLQINIGGRVENGKQTSQFMFQTSVSKRTFE